MLSLKTALLSEFVALSLRRSGTTAAIQVFLFYGLHRCVLVPEWVLNVKTEKPNTIIPVQAGIQLVSAFKNFGINHAC